MANSYRCVLLIFGLLIFVSNCELNFDPFEDNEEFYFSIQGALDASSDTQVVRVSPIRQVFRQDSEPIDAVVTLKHLETGDTVVMEDSLYQYADDVWAWNFLTDMPIIHGNTYELVATRSDGRFSRATAKIPEVLPQPVITYHCEFDGPTGRDVLGFINLFFPDTDRFIVADITYDYWISRPGQTAQDTLQYTESFLHNDITPPESSGKRLWIRWFENLEQISGEFNLSWTRVNITGTAARFVLVGPDWPDYEGLDLNEAALPEANNNIEQGLGVLAGMTRMENVVLDIEGIDFFCPNPPRN